MLEMTLTLRHLLATFSQTASLNLYRLQQQQQQQQGPAECDRSRTVCSVEHLCPESSGATPTPQPSFLQLLVAHWLALSSVVQSGEVSFPQTWIGGSANVVIKS